MNRALLVAAALAAFHAKSARAQTDPQLLAEAKVAMEKYNDCKAADQALEKISSKGRIDPVWALTKSRVAECLKHYDEALTNYLIYSRAVPNDPAVLQHEGELSYLAGREKAQRADSQKAALELKQRRDDPSGLWRWGGETWRVTVWRQSITAVQEDGGGHLYARESTRLDGTYASYAFHGTLYLKLDGAGHCHGYVGTYTNNIELRMGDDGLTLSGKYIPGVAVVDDEAIARAADNHYYCKTVESDQSETISLVRER